MEKKKTGSKCSWHNTNGTCFVDRRYDALRMRFKLETNELFIFAFNWCNNNRVNLLYNRLFVRCTTIEFFSPLGSISPSLSHSNVHFNCTQLTVRGNPFIQLAYINTNNVDYLHWNVHNFRCHTVHQLAEKKNHSPNATTIQIHSNN